MEYADIPILCQYLKQKDIKAFFFMLEKTDENDCNKVSVKDENISETVNPEGF